LWVALAEQALELGALSGYLPLDRDDAARNLEESLGTPSRSSPLHGSKRFIFTSPASILLKIFGWRNPHGPITSS
jgi:hypothetical protein